MVLRWHLATKEQLLTVLSEDCPIEFKYRAAFELQHRKRMKKADYLQEIVYLFGRGLLVPEIAKALSISHMKVEKIINHHQLWKTRLHQEIKRTDASHKGSSFSYFNGKRVSY